MEPVLFWTAGDASSTGAVADVGASSLAGASGAGASGVGAPERFLGGGGWKGLHEGGP